MERYQGKKVVIIGGTSGMGLATAKMLLDGGARVLVTGRSKAGLESAQKELGKDAIVVSSDARSLTEIDALASRVKAEFDTFDLLFVNAGFSCRASLENMTEAIYDEMFNPERQGSVFRGAEARAVDEPGWRCRLHDLRRKRQGNARDSPIRSRQGCAPVVRSDARC
jgi:NAD(P)-dependent dehydrogenase (short-subunit alcohol dehydrogenase family)